MATGNQKVKTPTGWNATQGAWVKTPTGWNAVDQIYIKTPVFPKSFPTWMRPILRHQTNFWNYRFSCVESHGRELQEIGFRRIRRKYLPFVLVVLFQNGKHVVQLFQEMEWKLHQVTPMVIGSCAMQVLYLLAEKPIRKLRKSQS